MRAVVSEDARVGLLLFDEPSASLDPTAEHGVFSPVLCRATRTLTHHRYVRAVARAAWQ